MAGKRSLSPSPGDGFKYRDGHCCQPRQIGLCRRGEQHCVSGDGSQIREQPFQPAKGFHLQVDCNDRHSVLPVDRKELKRGLDRSIKKPLRFKQSNREDRVSRQSVQRWNVQSPEANPQGRTASQSTCDGQECTQKQLANSTSTIGGQSPCRRRPKAAKASSNRPQASRLRFFC